jgi:glyoxylase-like metal-dependent hydrolase (beta-lactamase superfamily II)
MDSGLAVPDRTGILELLQKEDLRIAAVLTSHAHIDHTGNHQALQREHGATIYMTPFDAAVSGSPMNLKAYLYGTSYHGVMDYGASMLCRTDKIIYPEDTQVEVEGARFDILRLPGHAPEHLGFVTPDRVAYVADALMSDKVLDSVRIPYCMCCELDFQTKRALREMNYARYIIPHNGVYDEIAALADRNAQKLQEKIETVAGLAGRYMTMETLVAKAAAAMGVTGDTIYKVRVAERNIRVFVEHLLDIGRLVQRANQGVIEYVRTDCQEM